MISTIWPTCRDSVRCERLAKPPISSWATAACQNCQCPALPSKVEPESKAELALEAAIAKLDKYHLLILDDLAYITKDRAETSALFS